MKCDKCNPPQPTTAGTDGECFCCADCSASCEHCSGPNDNQCLTCKQQYGFQHQVPNATSTTATAGRQAGFCECVDGKYKAYVNEGCDFKFECVDCHDSCEKCAGEGADQCTVCKTGAELIRNADGTVPEYAACICKPGYSFSALTGSCKKLCTDAGKWGDNCD